MNIVQLTKKYRLVWNLENQIIVNAEFASNSVTGAVLERSFEADTQAEIDDKLQELNLIPISDE